MAPVLKLKLEKPHTLQNEQGRKRALLLKEEREGKKVKKEKKAKESAKARIRIVPSRPKKRREDKRREDKRREPRRELIHSVNFKGAAKKLLSMEEDALRAARKERAGGMIKTLEKVKKLEEMRKAAEKTEMRTGKGSAKSKKKRNRKKNNAKPIAPKGFGSSR